MKTHGSRRLQPALMSRARRQNPSVPVRFLTTHLPNSVATCIGCNCTDLHACDTLLGPCHWIKVDYKLGIGVCCECDHKLEEYKKRIEQFYRQEAQGVSTSNLEKTCTGPEAVE